MKWKKYYKESSYWLDDRMDEYGITIKQISNFSPDKDEGGFYADAEYLIDEYMYDEYEQYHNYAEEDLEEITDDIGFTSVIVFYENDEDDYPEKTAIIDYFDYILFIFDKDGVVLN